jgi:hypothetical protein
MAQTIGAAGAASRSVWEPVRSDLLKSGRPAFDQTAAPEERNTWHYPHRPLSSCSRLTRQVSEAPLDGKLEKPQRWWWDENSSRSSRRAGEIMGRPSSVS